MTYDLHVATRRRPPYPPSPGKKSLPDDQNDRVRALARQIVRQLGSTTEAARALGVSQPYLSQVLGGAHGAGVTLLDGLARYTGKSTDEIRSGIVNSSAHATSRTMATWMGRVPAGALDGWEGAEEAARRACPEVPAWAWDEARTLATPRGAVATVDLATDLAYFSWRHLGAEVRSALEQSAQQQGAARLRTPPGAPSVARRQTRRGD
jgi:transcriptional regulator with XRE-family HTH domain